MEKDPYLVGLVTNFQMLLGHPEHSSPVSRVLASFDIQALESEATRVMKKSRCIESYPIAQGGFNTVFVLTFEDGTDVIARLARSAFNDNAECAEDALTHSLLSEVSTLAFVKEHTSIPVPEVYHFESNANNPVGARYMIMERILGHPLGTTWYTMSSQQRQQLVTQLAGMEAELLNTRFPAIGCLVDASGTVGQLGLSSTYPFALRDPHRGPFTNSKDFIVAHVRSELALLNETPDEWARQRAWWSNINGGIDDIPTPYAIKWFQLLLDGINALAPEEFEPQDFSLFHDDFDMKNILVSDSGTVVGIIDWEGSRICPLWNSGRYSTFLRDPNVLDDESEVASLRQLQKNIIEGKTGKKYPGSSPLRLGTLLYMVDYTHSVRSTRATIDDLFLAWFNVITKIGYVRELEPFLPLKHFIECTTTDDLNPADTTGARGQHPHAIPRPKSEGHADPTQAIAGQRGSRTSIDQSSSSDNELAQTAKGSHLQDIPSTWFWVNLTVTPINVFSWLAVGISSVALAVVWKRSHSS
ncbi:kinase-like domain-containing protein [Mycena metata]|uniref:Kinase-like domain-containing protein n=1 Tax=Mycena metata TaxID=1033252 RepID=A0AAD7I089_9AGAR|nr:kinase-like domain-containing protein [Mycena metata]